MAKAAIHRTANGKLAFDANVRNDMGVVITLSLREGDGIGLNITLIEILPDPERPTSASFAKYKVRYSCGHDVVIAYGTVRDAIRMGLRFPHKERRCLPCTGRHFATKRHAEKLYAGRFKTLGDSLDDLLELDAVDSHARARRLFRQVEGNGAARAKYVYSQEATKGHREQLAGLKLLGPPGPRRLTPYRI